MANNTKEQVISALKWQIDMGVDATIGEEPVNLLEAARNKKIAKEKAGNKAEVPKISALEPKNTNISAISSENTSDLENKTRKLADNAKNLEELHKIVCEFKELTICRTATNVVFCDGNPDSKVMIIGEAPGADEDRQGIPFCGQSGQLMDKALKFINLDRKENLYVSNTLFWRPPGNRKPAPEELKICEPFVQKHIALIKPEILLLVGGTSASSLLSTKTGITKIHGKFHEYTNPYLDSPVKAFPLFHPSFLLRQPMQKKAFWQDLLVLQEYLEQV